MKACFVRLVIGLLVSLEMNAAASVLYVALTSTNPIPPYADWSTAATNIQDAIDAAAPGDLVLVTNGIYESGGRVVYGGLTNRVVLDKALTVQSVNGPSVTLIVGNSPIGADAIRCAYLTNGAALNGFTLTNGATATSFQNMAPADMVHLASGGGVLCEDTSAVLSNCVLVANSAEYGWGGRGGGAYSGTLEDSTISGNQALYGGGAFGSVLASCRVVDNHSLSAPVLTGGEGILAYGGGANSCTLTNCTLADNTCQYGGGGADASAVYQCIVEHNQAVRGGGLYSCTVSDSSLLTNAATSYGGGCASSGELTNCFLMGNRAFTGGGASYATLDNCVISGNFAMDSGGGAWSCTLNGCALVENWANTNGGAGIGSVLNHCSVAGNRAFSGGGTSSCTLTNCIVFYNRATNGPNYAGGTFDHCCTKPLPTGGLANINAAPGFADRYHLSPDSPCRGAGSVSGSAGADIDDEPWANPPSMGCDEYYSNSADGSLTVAIQSDHANARPGVPINFSAWINRHAGSSAWDFGDGTVLTNRPYAAHTWVAAGDYTVTLRAYNLSNPGGISATVMVHVLNDPVQYVALTGTNPVPPFLSWTTAATNIQDALDAAFAGGGTILVTNGVYQTGGAMATVVLSNRIAVTGPVTVQSVNGPSVTVIQGYQLPGSTNGDGAVRCAYLANGASLVGFTLTGGATREDFANQPQECQGGGAWCLSTNIQISNCVFVADASYSQGGGVYSGCLDNCVLSNNVNRIGSDGGGGDAAASGVLTDCSLIGNYPAETAEPGGVARSCIINNCLLARNFDAAAVVCTLRHCTITGNAGTGMIGGDANECTISSNVASSVPGLFYPRYLYSGGGATDAVLTNSVLSGNRASNGGGAYNCALYGCIVSNNAATNNGGGIYCDPSTQNTNLPGVADVVVGNTAGGSGGGAFLPLIKNWSMDGWIFQSNSAAADGGGLLSGGGFPILNSNFSGNSAAGNGGGVAEGTSGSTSSVVCTNCTFSANQAAGDGGGAYYAVLNNCLIEGNRASDGGGVYGAIYDCTVTANVATANGGGLYFVPPDPSLGVSPDSSDCTIAGNLGGSGAGAYIPSATPAMTFSNWMVDGNIASTNGGGIYMGDTGPVFKSCTIVSNQAALTGGGACNGTYLECSFSGDSAGQGGGFGVYYVYGSGLTNCVLSGNSAADAGGGAFGGTLTRCLLSGNYAGTNGGGAESSLSLCVLSDNHAGIDGGGACYSSLEDCLLTGNSAEYGGGWYGSYGSWSLNNCTVIENVATNGGGGLYFGGSSGYQMSATSVIDYDNSAPSGSNYLAELPNYVRFNYCCTAPLPVTGTSNIVSKPELIDPADGNFRLQTNSPCINAGDNNYFPLSATDLDGRPRVVGGTVDIGAYEFQGPGLGEFIGWLRQYGLATDGSADYIDSDGDFMNNWQEWIAGTNPTNSLSVLKMLSSLPATTPPGVIVSWQSVSGRSYLLERSAALALSPGFSVVQSNIVGQAGITTFTDTNAPGSGPCFYRVGIEH